MNRIAVVGDYSPGITAHRAVAAALALARAESAFEWQWIPTRDVHDARRTLREFAGVWLVPGSPYESLQGALAAVQFARESQRPFLGTCGGFQHALIEFARNVAGLADADHAESNPAAVILLITALTCSLVEQSGDIHLIPDCRLRMIYGQRVITEGYHCSYGLNNDHRRALEKAGLRFTAFDRVGDARGAELPPSMHPFFIGTLFQPERAALRGETPPVIRAFIAAACGVEHDATRSS